MVLWGSLNCRVVEVAYVFCFDARVLSFDQKDIRNEPQHQNNIVILFSNNVADIQSVPAPAYQDCD